MSDARKGRAMVNRMIKRGQITPPTRTLSTGDDVGLAGDFPELEIGADGHTTIRYATKPTGRVCGDCQLCCKLVPVAEIHKTAGVRCKHQKTGKGCTIYANRPFDCRAWSCRWLADRAMTDGMARPDRSHFVIDMMPDHVKVTDNDTGQDRRLDVIQVWVDPAFPEAAKSPELRAYMLRIAAHGYATIIRWNARDAYVVFPPSMMKDGQWHEQTGNVVAHNELERHLLEGWEAVTE